MSLTPQVKQGKMWYYNEPPQDSTPQVKQVKCGITMNLTPQVKQGKMWYYNEPDSTSKIG